MMDQSVVWHVSVHLGVDKDSENTKLIYHVRELERQIREKNSTHTPPLDSVDMGSGQGFVSTLETSSIGQTGEYSAISLSVGAAKQTNPLQQQVRYIPRTWSILIPIPKKS